MQIGKYKKGSVNSSRTRAAKLAAWKGHAAANREVRENVSKQKNETLLR